jgi:hypothetical protein
MGFLSRVQSWFSGRNQGRYLAFVLCELSRREPRALQDILCRAWGLGRKELPAPRLDPEYVFKGQKNSRRADIAVYASADAPEPRGLIEIKYLDALHPETDARPAQLEDYLHWEKSGAGRKVLILSREHLALTQAPTLTWTEVARQLRGYKEDSEIVRMLVEHLEEEGIVLQRVDSKAVVGFLGRLLCPWNGAGRQAGNLDGPTEFGKLLKNLQLLSERLNGDFKRAWDTAGGKHNSPDDPRGTKRASIDFDVYPRMKQPKKIERIFDKDGDGTLAISARDGGLADLFARHALGSGADWLRVGYGFQIELGARDPGRSSELPATYVYAWANGDRIQKRKLDFVSRQKLGSLELITESAEDSIDQIERLVRKHMRNVLDELIESPKLLTAKQRTAVMHLRRP